MGVGFTASWVTREYVQLNNFVPESMRKLFRAFGLAIGRINDGVDIRISEKLRPRKEFETYREHNEGFKNVKNFIGTVITGPIFEELVFRVPLVLASWTIDKIAQEFFHLPVLKGVFDGITGELATKGFLATVSSVIFTYVHDDKPAPHRAAGVFGVGLTLSYLAMSSDKGLIYAIVAHMLHNFISLSCGMQKISTGILSNDPEKVEKISESDQTLL
jgi:hypothetical protein